MAAIVLVGLLAGAAVLTGGFAAPMGNDEHGHAEDAHDEHGEGDVHDKSDQPTAKAGVASAGAGEDEHTQEDGHGDEHGQTEDVVVEAEPNTEVDRVMLSAEQVQIAGITVDTAGSARIRSSVAFPGEIRFNEDRTAHVEPRLAGEVESVPANLAQEVKKGDVLAIIASPALAEHRSELLAAEQRLRLATTTHEREKRLWEDRISAEQDYQQARAALQDARIAVQSAQQKLAAIGAPRVASELNRFELRAPFGGTVIEKHITLGEAVAADAEAFTLSDLSTVWAEFNVSAQDIVKVRVGERASVSSTAFTGTAEGTVAYVGSLIGERTRTAKARVTLTNPNRAWRPGLFVTVSVAVEEEQVSVAVRADAVQTIDNHAAVFVEIPGGFAARPVLLGRSDGTQVEVRQGLDAGERYAATNSFILKSELGKGSAEHTH